MYYISLESHAYACVPYYYYHYFYYPKPLFSMHTGFYAATHVLQVLASVTKSLLSVNSFLISPCPNLRNFITTLKPFIYKIWIEIAALCKKIADSIFGFIGYFLALQKVS